MNSQPRLSIVIPCRNEKTFIGKCLDSIIANDYPKDKLELFVVDGMSEDGTREIINQYSQKYAFIRVLENTKKITPCALNIGIRDASGEVVMRIDAHTTVEKNYISKCITYLIEYKAANVGGVWRILPRNNSLMGKTFTLVLSHPFGIGNAYYRFIKSGYPLWVDTVPFFCCRKEIFNKIGLFNENLARGQDQEFNLRLIKNRMKSLLVPEIVSYYYTQPNLKSFIKHNFINGVWAILPFRYSRIIPVSLRHLVPLVFISAVIIFGLSSFINTGSLYIFAAILKIYLLTNLYFSAKTAIKEKDIRFLFLSFFVFAALHASYGLGSLFGLIRYFIYNKASQKSIFYEQP